MSSGFERRMTKRSDTAVRQILKKEETYMITAIAALALGAVAYRVLDCGVNASVRNRR